MEEAEAPVELEGKSHIRVIKSKLFVPTANLIHSQWVPVEKEHENKWSITLGQPSILEAPLPVPPANHKFSQVKSKLHATTAATEHQKYQPKPKESEEEGNSPSKKLSTMLLSPSKPVPDRLLKLTANNVHGQWVKPPAPPSPKAVEHRRVIEFQPASTYKEIASKLHVPTAASIHQRYTPPKNLNHLGPHADLQKVPFRPSSPCDHANPLSSGGYLGMTGGSNSDSHHRRGSTVMEPFAAATPQPSRRQTTLNYTPTPSRDVWSSHSREEIPARSTPYKSPGKALSARRPSMDSDAENGHSEGDVVSPSLLKETYASVNSHYKKVTVEPTRQEILFQQHGHKLDLVGEHHHHSPEDVPNSLLKETAATIHGHYSKENVEQIHAPEPVPLNPNRRASVNGEAAKAARRASTSLSSSHAVAQSINSTAAANLFNGVEASNASPNSTAMQLSELDENSAERSAQESQLSA